MGLDSISVARLKLVNPTLAATIYRMADVLSQQGLNFRVVQGFRTWADQDALYAQGRTTPGKIVTNAKGGESWHCLGCAVDLVPMNPLPDWDLSHDDWQRMLTVGLSLGLTEGAKWCHPDTPHFQYTNPYPENAPNDEARQIFKSEGAAAFWSTIK